MSCLHPALPMLQNHEQINDCCLKPLHFGVLYNRYLKQKLGRKLLL